MPACMSQASLPASARLPRSDLDKWSRNIADPDPRLNHPTLLRLPALHLTTLPFKHARESAGEDEGDICRVVGTCETAELERTDNRVVWSLRSGPGAVEGFGR